MVHPFHMPYKDGKQPTLPYLVCESHSQEGQHTQTLVSCYVSHPAEEKGPANDTQTKINTCHVVAHTRTAKRAS